ncbi:aldo/keto reductase [Nakamurella lactea]|uniref:aldo/keto reductase n=1 Tax=Nakamurella lactea TaxID=459515 RepID=UPI00055F315F|nr:aldo/keto reductase [Nakamurella lactea]
MADAPPVLPPLGYGAANVGNLYRELTDDAAWAVLEAAWDAGIRYYDTAPHYGLGLSERRLGAFLATRPRNEFVLSTKVGRLLRPNPEGAGTLDLANDFAVPADLRREWDFSADGIRRSVDESLQRLGLDRVDIVYLHDPERHDLTVALDSGLAGAIALREEGVVSAIGVGSMDTAALQAAVDTGALDLLMIAGRYTLLEQPAASGVLPACAKHSTGVVLASVFNSGVLAKDELAADARYEYGPVPSAIRTRYQALARICHAHGVRVPAAALQFGLRNELVRSVIVGAASPQQITESAAAMATPIPDALWDELAEQGLLG